MNSQGTLTNQGCESTTVAGDYFVYSYKEEPYEEDMFKEDMDWKKQQEKVVRF